MYEFFYKNLFEVSQTEVLASRMLETSTEYDAMVARFFSDATKWFLGKKHEDIVTHYINHEALTNWMMVVSRKNSGMRNKSILPEKLAKHIFGFIGPMSWKPDGMLTAVDAHRMATIGRTRQHHVFDIETKGLQEELRRIFVKHAVPQINKLIGKGEFEGSIEMTPQHMLSLRHFSAESKENKSDLDLMSDLVRDQGFEVIRNDSTGDNKLFLRWQKPPEPGTPSKRAKRSEPVVSGTSVTRDSVSGDVVTID